MNETVKCVRCDVWRISICKVFFVLLRRLRFEMNAQCVCSQANLVDCNGDSSFA